MKYLSGISKHQLGWESFTLEIGLSKKTSHPLTLTIHKREKSSSHGWPLYFIKIIGILRFQNPSINQIQFESVWLLMLCHVASLFTFPLVPNSSKGILAFCNSHQLLIRFYIYAWHVRYFICNPLDMTCVITIVESLSLVS